MLRSLKSLFLTQIVNFALMSLYIIEVSFKQFKVLLSWIDFEMQWRFEFSFVSTYGKGQKKKHILRLRKLFVWIICVKLLEKLFDSIITPVLLYCSEIWGIYNNIDENSIIEKFCMKFIKEFLGVHCKTTNAPCRADLLR
jgi:hypothetical protein